VRAAWRARSGPFGILPLAMTAFVLVSKMTTSAIYTKAHWFVLALAMASDRQVVGALSRAPKMVHAVRRRADGPATPVFHRRLRTGAQPASR
jgi:hypothetical protein